MSPLLGRILKDGVEVTLDLEGLLDAEEQATARRLVRRLRNPHLPRVAEDAAYRALDRLLERARERHTEYLERAERKLDALSPEERAELLAELRREAGA